MINTNLQNKLKKLHKRLSGCTIEYDLTNYQSIFNKIDSLKSHFEKQSDEQLKDFSQSLAQSAGNGEVLENLIVEAFALVREAIWRVLKLKPFDVQILGAIALHQGKLAEMQTGEGKTLTAVFPAYLNALTGNGVHVLTFNDYLARRDAQWMGPVYQFLGLSVGYVQEGMTVEERQKAYQSDLTYLTAKEAGFDYLRDSLCYEKDHVVHRPFSYAIVDEADSILIDEARIPLIIAGAAEDYVPDTYRMADIARRLERDVHFEFDEYARNIHLTDAGQENVETKLNCGNLYAPENFDLLTRLHCSIHAEYLLQNDVNYIIRDDKVELVDEFTGRVADKRRWPDGLQAAIEAKENINIQSKGNILNSITLQHFLQLYPKICGMTATAQPAEEEFRSFYNLHIVVIPPNELCIRIDFPDIIFKSKTEKNQAILNEIISVHESGRPILVGTRSVEESALLAEALRNEGIDCEVLNAKRDQYEAEIITQAGRLNAVTISTNMAGRGTDIRLGGSDESEKMKIIELGGLYVIGTNKHESQRIDQQLRGRSGRQGDPGSSRFFICLNDDLFIKYRLAELLPALVQYSDQDGKIDNPIIKREVARLQRICEGQNLDIKMTLYKYSSLIEKQRIIFFSKRIEILFDHEETNFFKQKSPKKYKQFCSIIGENKLKIICREISLFYIDNFWSNYLAEIADIRESIHLKRVGGQNPYIEFQKMVIKIFDELLIKLATKLVNVFNGLQIQNNSINLEELGIKAPSATWTYLINDNPFEFSIGIQLIGDPGKQIGAVMMTPFLALSLLFRKKKNSIE